MPYPSNPAPTDVPIHNLLSKRWSTRAFSAEPIPEEQIKQLFEAARWAPSSGNTQPWLYVYAVKDGSKHRANMEDLLAEGNYWAKEAYLLIVAFANTKRVNSKGEKVESPYALHDTGAASLSLVLQATALDLCSHQMGGFAKEAANSTFGIEADYVPASMIAIGHYGSVESLTEKHRDAETAERKRRSQDKFIVGT